MFLGNMEKISVILPRESSVSHVTGPNTMLNKFLLIIESLILMLLGQD